MRSWLLPSLFIIALAPAPACKNLPEWQPQRFVSGSPSQSWSPDPDERWFTHDAMAESPSAEAVNEGVMSLTELVDLGLRNNPITRLSWERARAAAAGYGEARAELYPTVELGGSTAVSNTTDPNDFLSIDTGAARWLIEGFSTLEYLLTDFGGRRARIEEAKQALYFANWFQNQKIQDVLRDVAQAYYRQQGFRAEIQAVEENLENAVTTTDAAQERLDVGVGTIADLLQAEANEAQVRVDLAAVLGDWEVARGNLATAVGWPADTAIEIDPAPTELPFNEIVQDAERLIDLAQESRPVLAAAVAFVREREQVVLQAKSRRRPLLTASASVGEQLLLGDGRDSGFIYGGTVDITVPIFTGGELRSALRKAEADLEAAKAGLRDAEQLVISAVWTAYYDFRTASEQTTANEVFLASSNEAYLVSLSRFRNGIGDIVELLNAQALLARARAELVRARMRTLSAYAELVHAVGSEVATRRVPRPTPDASEMPNDSTSP